MKKIEKTLKENMITFKHENRLDELSSIFSEEQDIKKPKYFYFLALATLLLFVFVRYNLKTTETLKTDYVVINEIEYVDNQTISSEINDVFYTTINEEDIDKVFTQDYCNSQCTVYLDHNNYIHFNYDYLPLFTFETTDNWSEFTSKLEYSKIDNYEIILIKNSDVYLTKFFKNNVGIAIEMNSKEELIEMVKKILEM